MNLEGQYTNTAVHTTFLITMRRMIRKNDRGREGRSDYVHIASIIYLFVMGCISVGSYDVVM